MQEDRGLTADSLEAAADILVRTSNYVEGDLLIVFKWGTDGCPPNREYLRLR